MTLVTLVFLCGSLRTNAAFVVVFFTLIFAFSVFAAGNYQLGYDPTAAGVAHAVYYFKLLEDSDS
jgi:succinate-acetate transporter protein